MVTVIPPISLLALNFLGWAGIIAWHLQGRTRPNARLVVQIIFFAAMTLLLTAAQIVPFRFERNHEDELDRFLVDGAKTLWWTHLAWATIGFTRIYIVLEKRPREARLIQDLLIAVIYLGTSLSIMAFVFGVPIGTLLATSGIFAIILGLALQNTLSDVFSGLALTVGRPYVLGDWILLGDGTEGRVAASNWRSTSILTSAHNLIVLPNSVLAKLGLTNFSRPTEAHQLELSIRIALTQPPNLSMEILRLALSSCNLISREFQPTVSLQGMDAMGIDVLLLFHVSTIGERTAARNEVIDLVFRHCRANGVALAMPTGSNWIADGMSFGPHRWSTLQSPQELLQAVPGFGTLTASERQTLIGRATTRQFSAGALIADESETLSSLMIIQAGIVCRRRDGNDIERLSPGDCFGVRGVFGGRPENGSLCALTKVTLCIFNENVLRDLTSSRPELAEEFESRFPKAASEVSDNHVHPSPAAKEPIAHKTRSLFGH
ncbi:mechanosensitive ion channel domain-containing protein [Rhizobium sp. Root482]|uniref:mechanosensitive ion channel domain-containing protein n=1 Tax=Rhizobium sp. Root482 TaxID=1736543 RepID=UPI0006F6595F|nr:mechanosensitive ion channel domain-containing protein [Rhizobium sp. Root482]KQY22507.1 small mechanosensitive ion channel [Rhizobium sp. Root482]